MACEAALERLCDREAQVSSHYVIDEDGTVYGLVDEVHCVKMWHVLLYTVKFHCYQNALVMMSLRMISEW